MRRSLLLTLVLFAIPAFSTSAAAELRVKPFSTGEKVFIGGTALTLGIFELDQKLLTPEKPRWTRTNSVDEFFRDHLRRSSLGARRSAAKISDVTGYGAPLLMIGWTALAARGGNHDEIETNALTIVESATVAMTLNHAAKRIFGRQRPRVRDTEEGSNPQVDDNLSFYSGHTTLAFAVAAAAGRIADIEGYDSRKAIWATGLTLAVATGAMRMASDNHYFTDVLTGAVTGTAVGLIVANRRRADAEPAADSSHLGFFIRTNGRSLALGLR